MVEELVVAAEDSAAVGDETPGVSSGETADEAGGPLRREGAELCLRSFGGIACCSAA